MTKRINIELITIGDWKLERLNTGDPRSGINHIPCDSWAYRSARLKRCTICKLPIPDDIYGVWLLHNFNNIKEIT